MTVETLDLDPEIVARVHDLGAPWMDEHRPSWYRLDHINLPALNMRDGCRCVLGQDFNPGMDGDEWPNGYTMAERFITRLYPESLHTSRLRDEWLAAHGFLASTELLDEPWAVSSREGIDQTTDAMYEEYDQLKVAWTREIVARREAAQS